MRHLEIADPQRRETSDHTADDAADEAAADEHRQRAGGETRCDTGPVGDGEGDVAGQRGHQEAERQPAEREQHRAQVLQEPTRRQVGQRVVQCDVVAGVGDLVTAEQEAQRDQQTARGDERDHVTDTGQQDLAGAGAPADLTGGRARGAGVGAGALDLGRVRIIRGGNGFGDHLGRFVDGALDTGGDDGLAGEAALVLDADVGGEDDGVGARDDVGGQRGAARGALRLDGELDPGLLGRGGQRVGGHVGVGDAGRARGDRDQVLGPLLLGGLVGGSGGGIGRRLRVHHPVDQLDHLVGAAGVAHRLDEVLAHQRPRQCGQQLHVVLAARLGRGDQERQIGRAVRGAEVDLGGQPGETDGRGVDVGGAAVRNRDTAGQPGGRLLLAGHRGADQTVGVGGAPGVGQRADELGDRGLLVALDVGVEQHQVTGDDRR